MHWERIFLDKGLVRPVWRFFFSVALIVSAYVVVGLTLGFLLGPKVVSPSARGLDFLLQLFLVNLLLLPALLAVFKFLTSAFEKKPLGSMGLAFHAGWSRELALGLALGAAMMLGIAVFERALGLASFQWSTSPSALGAALVAGSGVLLLMAAATEELTFRGYPFQRLVDWLGPIPAVLAVSATFGLAHLGNPNHTWASALNTMLVGITFAVAYLRTRALWMPIGMHFIWNFLQGVILGLPLSGLDFPVTLLRARVGGAVWLTGGAYGPEGGLLASAAIVAATLYVLFSKRICLTEDMRRLTSSELPPASQPFGLGLDFAKGDGAAEDEPK